MLDCFTSERSPSLSALSVMFNFNFNTTHLIIHLQVDVPKDRILLGAKGSTSSRFIMKLAREAVRQVIMISGWLRLTT